jgi:hypothetical protein
MSFTPEEVEQLMLKLAHSHRTKRKFDFHQTPGYNESMSRTQLLAKAFDGEVIEDFGYRGIIYVKEKNEFIRYHTTAGVHSVERQPRVWRTKRHILTPEEIRPFLEEIGLLPKIVPIETPIDQMARITGSTVVQTFQTGGGVFKSPRDVYYRFSNISGLDIVTWVVTKWRMVRHVAHRTTVLRALYEHTLQDILDKESIEYDRRADDGGADRGGSPASTGATPQAEGVPEGVPAEEDPEAGRQSGAR